MEYLRKVDFARLTAVDDRVTQPLFDGDSGAASCSVTASRRLRARPRPQGCTPTSSTRSSTS
jgi:hypothetical protein